MLIKRELHGPLLRVARHYPVVVVTGPRQSGKTTLVKMAFPKLPYFSLEDPDIRELALLDPRAFLSKVPRGAILDEIQRVPNLPSYLQGLVDQKRGKIKFILTGSHQFEVMERVSQSLAGRSVLVKLLPFSLQELDQMKRDMSLIQYIYHGFYPRIHDKKLNPTEAYRNYFETYIERDLRQMINVKDLRQFRKFVKLCAGRIGQIFVADHLANEVGVSIPTINAWVSILEASFIVFFLEPYYENIGKRLIKSPKLYFTDVGLASYLLGIESGTQVDRDPLWGSLVENLTVCELFKKRFNVGKDSRLYFYRDSNLNEVDVIFQRGRSLTPVEIKAAQTFNQGFLKNIHYFMKLFPNRAKKAYVVYSGRTNQTVGKVKLMNFKQAREIVG